MATPIIKEQGKYQTLARDENGPTVLFIPLEMGAMLGSPFWTNDLNCWAAKVRVFPMEPGGLSRTFLKVGGAKEHYFVAREFKRGDALEFGAKGSRQRSAWVVADTTPKYITIVRAKDGLSAARSGALLESNDPTETARINAMLTPPEVPEAEVPEAVAPVQTRRERVSAMVRARWPNHLTPNQFTNTVLDIIRSGGQIVSQTPMDPMDVLEAVDALTEMHLDVSKTSWKE